MTGYQNTALELLKQAQNLGLLGTSITINCKECNAVFPTEYVFCPKCKSEESFLDSVESK
ncbi:MAG: hypothetical protein R3237_01595 [Nitrosopumilaceae archaeon]|nr:hypothetical protein [Nitrosopumilaceae archaeon]